MTIWKILIICLLVLVPNNITSGERISANTPKVNYSLIWGKSYQSENCPIKKAVFDKQVNRLYGNAYRETELREITLRTAQKYISLGYNPLKLSELLYRIALHESHGGLYTKQIKGPARSWFQIEPATAKGLIKNNPELIIGFNVKELSTLSTSALADLLEKRQDIAATIAAAKIIETGERTGTNNILKT